MPRLSAELRAHRRRHVLVSAWKCFSEDGFHATSMDQVIAASGVSSSAVYRYFRSKDELIDATVDEAFGLFEQLLSELLAAEPAPTPRQAVTGLIDTVRSRSEHPDYDLSKLAMQAWVEALRRPHLRERVAEFYRTAGGHLRELAERWQQAGQLASGVDTAAVAALLTTMMPGMIVAERLVGALSPEQIMNGIEGLVVRDAT